MKYLNWSLKENLQHESPISKSLRVPLLKLLNSEQKSEIWSLLLNWTLMNLQQSYYPQHENKKLTQFHKRGIKAENDPYNVYCCRF